jgi:Asp-tRNA(Asn)/Glu-tRNA(Gln) amidotransferase A subunit family amidase
LNANDQSNGNPLNGAFKSADFGDKVWLFFCQHLRLLASLAIVILADLAMLLHTIAGYDERDSTSCWVNIPDYHSLLDRSLKPCRLDIPRDYFAEGIDGDVQRGVEKAIDFSRAQGHQIVDISLPHTPHTIPVYYLVMIAEASSNLARYNGIRYTRRSQTATNALDIYFKSRREGFEPEVKRGEGGRKRGGEIGKGWS